MITTPSKSDSNKFSNTSKNNNLEISDNKVNDDFSVPSISIYNKKIDEENNNSINNSKNLSKIHTSIIADDLEQLEKLLKLGGNPDVLNKSGETPLYLSVDIENYDAMIILLEFGADCNIQKNDGNTALHLATEKKSELYISALLSHGANPNIINKTNLQTPLHIGIINKINEYILSKFKENNGDIYNIKDKYNKTPFDYAKNDEKYKNLLISIFSEQNKNNDDEKNKCINENSVENYHNFISLSRKIHIADEENNNRQNNDNKESEKSNNNIRDINNCLKKHLMFSSNSKEASSEEKKKKLNVFLNNY
jgi:ankyrin repeat protein